MRGNAGSGPRDGQFSQGSQGPGLAEALVVWALLAVVGLCVVMVLGLTVWAGGISGIGGGGKGGRGGARILGAAARTIVSLPWIFAEIGVYIGDVPLLGHVFRSKQLFVHDGELGHSVHL